MCSTMVRDWTSCGVIDELHESLTNWDSEDRAWKLTPRITTTDAPASVPMWCCFRTPLVGPSPSSPANNPSTKPSSVSSKQPPCNVHGLYPRWDHL
jgi:hypothetical protein